MANVGDMEMAKLSRERIKAELAKLEEAEHAGHAEARQSVMEEVAKLHDIHEDVHHQQRRALPGLNTKAASAAKGLNLKKDATSLLQKDAAPKQKAAWGGLKSILGMKAAEQAVVEDAAADAGAGVNLLQKGASLISNKRKKHQEL